MEHEIWKLTFVVKLPCEEVDAVESHLRRLAEVFDVDVTDYTLNKELLGIW